MSDISITDQNNDHKYFSILQNILSYIGLTAFERSVYWALKECAGENGSCTKSYAKLAVMSGLSIPSLKRTLEILSQKNKILKKPLIQIINRLTEYGDRDTNEIVLVSLWSDNMKHFQKENGQVTQTSPRVRLNQPKVTQNQGVRSHRPEGQFTQSYKEEPLNKNPMNKNSPPLSTQDLKRGEGREIEKEILKVIEKAKEFKMPFSESAIFSVYKLTSGIAVEQSLIAFSKRSKKAEDLKYPDQWLKKEAEKIHDFHKQKKEIEGKE